MRLIILLGRLAIALPFIISAAAISFGNAVSSRFLERPTRDGAHDTPFRSRRLRESRSTQYL
jgi:hypothetical protein